MLKKNANHTFPEPKVTTSIYLFCPKSSQKHKDSSLTIMKDKKTDVYNTLQLINERLMKHLIVNYQFLLSSTINLPFIKDDYQIFHLKKLLI